MASRDLQALAPAIRARALAFIAECRACGLDVLIYCTARSADEQAALYARGRTAPGPIVTAARPGQSKHNPDADGWAWAFDAVPLAHGKPLWDDDAALLQMGVCGEQCGLTWAGRWRGKLRERVHFEMEK